MVDQGAVHSRCRDGGSADPPGCGGQQFSKCGYPRIQGGCGFGRGTAEPVYLPSQRHPGKDSGAAGPAAAGGYLGTGTAVAQVTMLKKSGFYRQTGRELDFALQGDGYFVVATPAGEGYTRNGSFQVNDRGQLTTDEGFLVLSRTGGTIQADDPDMAASLAVVAAPADLELTKAGHNLLIAPAPLYPAETAVRQGVLEEANVSPVEAMVDLITAMRTYEAGQKAIQTQDQTLDKLINEVGRV